MTITAIPTRTIGSLGPTKGNRRAVSDPYQQIDADEYNLAADCVVYLVGQVGTETGYASTSLRGRVDTLEDPDALLFRDPLLGPGGGALREPWAATGGGLDWHYIGLAGGGMYGTLDATDSTGLGCVVDRDHAPRMRWRASVDGTPGTGLFMRLVNGAGTVAAGVEFLGAANAINAYRDHGGARVSTESLGTWVASTEYTFDLIVTAAGAVTVSMDGGTAVSVGTLTADGLSPIFSTSADGGGGDFAYVRCFLLTADWTTA